MDRIDEPLEVLSHKTFPGGAQLTKVKVAGHVAYVRENVGPDLVQILELSAPAEVWARIAAVIVVEDHLKRPVRSVEFSDWAEAELAR